MTQELKATIIGFWRSGAPLEQICWITKKRYQIVHWIIEDYKKSLLTPIKQN